MMVAKLNDTWWQENVREEGGQLEGLVKKPLFNRVMLNNKFLSAKCVWANGFCLSVEASSLESYQCTMLGCTLWSIYTDLFVQERKHSK
jgi:hypothetical protein